MKHDPEGKMGLYPEIKVSHVQGTIKWSYLGVKCGYELDLSFNLLSVMYADARC